MSQFQNNSNINQHQNVLLINPDSSSNQKTDNPTNHDSNNNQIASEEHNINYYQEYCRLFIANVVLTTQMKEIIADKNDLLNKLSQLEKRSKELLYHDGLESQEDKKKRFRRTATEISRHYQCPNQQCQKQYGSEGSLNQHIKLKHPEIYQSQFGDKRSEDSQLDKDSISDQKAKMVQ